MGCLWYNSGNKEKAFNCQFCAVEHCESRHSEFDAGASISSTTIQLPRGRDELDEWLEEECNIHVGSCSSIECLKHDVGRDVAEKMKKHVIEKAVSWWKNRLHNTVTASVLIEEFKKEMEDNQ